MVRSGAAPGILPQKAARSRFMRVLRRFVLSMVALMAFAPSLLGQAQPLTMTKSFNPSTVGVGGTSTTTMTVTITNPNASSVSGISFSDTYPAGLVPDQVGN